MWRRTRRSWRGGAGPGRRPGARGEGRAVRGRAAQPGPGRRPGAPGRQVGDREHGPRPAAPRRAEEPDAQAADQEAHRARAGQRRCRQCADRPQDGGRGDRPGRHRFRSRLVHAPGRHGAGRRHAAQALLHQVRKRADRDPGHHAVARAGARRADARQPHADRRPGGDARALQEARPGDPARTGDRCPARRAPEIDAAGQRAICVCRRGAAVSRCASG